MPSGLPNKQPGNDAQRQHGRQPVQRQPPPRETPALANANSGRIIKATHGCSTCSSCLAGDLPSCGLSGTKKPTITPASVAWTPDFSTAVHKHHPHQDIDTDAADIENVQQRQHRNRPAATLRTESTDRWCKNSAIITIAPRSSMTPAPSGRFSGPPARGAEQG